MKNKISGKRLAAGLLSVMMFAACLSPAYVYAEQTKTEQESRTEAGTETETESKGAESTEAENGETEAAFDFTSVKFKLNPSVKGIKLSWTNSKTQKSYRIYRREGDGKWKKLTDSDQTSYLDTKTSHGVTYSYSLVPLDEEGKTTGSYDKTGLSMTFVNAPVLKSVTGNEKSITVKWEKVDDVDSYAVYRYGGSDSDWTLVGETEKLTWTDKKAKTGVEYQYVVRAKLGENLSGYYSGKSATAGKAQTAESGNYIFPIKASYTITSSFGARVCPYHGTEYHNGIDIACPYGTPVYAAAGGKVLTATYSSSWGNYIVISHAGSVTTQYAHLSKISVKAGDTVSQGQVIGNVGKTGNATGYHLDFRFFVGGVAKNPLNYVAR